MAKRRRKRARRPAADAVEDKTRLKSHLRGLGLASAKAYQAWCRKQGIGTGLLKSPKQQQKERMLVRRVQGAAALSRTRRHTRHPQQTIVKLYRREIPKGRLGADYLLKIRNLFYLLEEDGPSRRALLDLLLQVERYGDLFGLEPAITYYGSRPGNTYLEGLSQLARQHGDWLRPVEDWRPASHNPRRQFADLARHLTARYDVPLFMDAAWFQGDDAARQQQSWFKHIGRGQNIRTADVPVRLSKMMAHIFLQAPAEFTVPQAFRWSQVVGQGGSDELAQAIFRTPLGNSFEHEEFWSTVILFLANHPMLDPAYVGPVIDYIQHQRFVPQEIIQPGGAVVVADPPQPDYAMKGRSIDRLLRQVDQWHEELAQQVQGPGEVDGEGPRRGHGRLIQWDSAAIEGFSLQEGKKKGMDPVRWSIKELTSNRELVAEGKAMHHCVSSYTRNCRNGNTSIWSLRARELGRAEEPVLTIAVDPRSRAVMQVRGKYNILPKGKIRSKDQGRIDSRYHKLAERSQRVLQRWMEGEGLTRAY